MGNLSNQPQNYCHVYIYFKFLNLPFLLNQNEFVNCGGLKERMVSYFTEDKEKLADFTQWFLSAKNIVVISHQNPDGDAFGSGLGLCQFLKTFEFESINYISPTEYADYLAWMPGVADITVFDVKNRKPVIDLLKEADLIFCCDFSAVDRVKDMKDLLQNATAKKIIIDHHEQPENFGDLIFWNQKASSTCELVYQLIEKLGHKDKINLDCATCLYTGLLTDTGSFRFDATTQTVHNIAGELLQIGVNPAVVNRNLFDTNSPERLKFLGHVLSNKMVWLEEYRVCYFYISENELKEYRSKSGETEGIVNYGLSIKSSVLSVIFIEKDGMIKISFRSVGAFSVSELARNHFDGGGHHNASGGRSYASLDETIQKFVNLLPNYKNQLLSI